ncbi:hypothetical protein Leryth_002065 [Lithospermum erythrorhizon]|nr:hypothetical protein Leryth_002065 [Lithospermum erythrorhizon]
MKLYLHIAGSSSKPKRAQPKNENLITFSDMDFTSTIITQDEYSVSKLPGSTNSLSGKTSTDSTRKDHYKHNEGLLKPSQVPEMSAGSSSAGKSQESNKLNGEVVRIDDLRFSELSLASGEEDLKGNGSEINEQVCTGKGSASDTVDIKSSLKSSDSKKLNRSVTWADEITVGNASDLCEYKESGDKTRISVLEMEGNENSYRLASAEALADALMQVSDVVASGKSDVSDAVSEMGLIILPPPQELDGSTPQEDDDNEHNSELIPSKWPSKLGEPNFDLFDSDDSWKAL